MGELKPGTRVLVETTWTSSKDPPLVDYNPGTVEANLGGDVCEDGEVHVSVDILGIQGASLCDCVPRESVYPLTPGQRVLYEKYVLEPKRGGVTVVEGGEGEVVEGRCPPDPTQTDRPTPVRLDGDKKYRCLPEGDLRPKK